MSGDHLDYIETQLKNVDVRSRVRQTFALDGKVDMPYNEIVRWKKDRP